MSKMFHSLHLDKSLRLIFKEEGKPFVTELAKKLGIARIALSRPFNSQYGISTEIALCLSKLIPNTDHGILVKSTTRLLYIADEITK